VEAVWGLVGDPARYPDWAAGVVEVTGLAEIEEGAEYQQKTKNAFGAESATTFRIDELEELREIRLTCQARGLYSRWLLTEAQESTFVDLEIGMQPEAFRYRAFDVTMGKLWYRSLVDDSLDGLRAATRGSTIRP